MYQAIVMGRNEMTGKNKMAGIKKMAGRNKMAALMSGRLQLVLATVNLIIATRGERWRISRIFS